MKAIKQGWTLRQIRELEALLRKLRKAIRDRL